MTIRWSTVLILTIAVAQARGGEDKVHTVGKDALKITGKIADNDPKVKVTEPNVNVTVDLPAKTHLIKLQAGVKYRIDLTGADIDAVLAIQDSAGKQLDFNDDVSVTDLNSRLDFTAPKDGNYKVVCASLKGPGDYTLSVQLAGKDDKEPAVKQPGPGDKTPVGGVGEVKIEGAVTKADGPVEIVNVDIDKKLGLIPGTKAIKLPAKLHEVKLEVGKKYQIDVVAKDKVDPIIVVQDPAGKQLGFDDDGGGFPNSKLFVEPKTTGAHKIFAGTIGGEGKYLLTVKQIGAGGGPATPPGKVHEVGAGGLKITGKLDAQTKSTAYFVKMDAGKTYVIDMTSPNTMVLDPYLGLLDAKGKKLTENDDIAEDNLNARITFAAPETATYRIVATSFGGMGSGEFTVEVRRKE